MALRALRCLCAQRSGTLAELSDEAYCYGVLNISNRSVWAATVVLGVILFPFPSRAATNVGVEDAVRQYFSDAPIMVAIAKCESRFRMFAGNQALDGGSGGMIGVFQINSSVHEDYAARMGMNIRTLNGNLAYARYLYENEGTRPWRSSESCWAKESAVAPTTITTPATDRDAQIAHLKAIIAALTQQLYELKRARELAVR